MTRWVFDLSMSEDITLSIDAMGGDDAPGVVLTGVAEALAADEALRVILCGPAQVVDPFARAHERCTAQAAEEVIAMGEHPANAVRRKKDSSIVVGCQLVRTGAAQGFFSAGSTGACLAAATLHIGRIRGIKRPALAQVIPAAAGPCLLIDVGANADCKPQYLVQFAQMASVYASDVLDIEHPRIGLLNIGEEDAKGSTFAQQAHALLRKHVPAFAGNCEPGDLLQGRFDVVVTDGFTGNIALKTIEGSAQLLFGYMKDALSSGVKEKIGAALVAGRLRQLKHELSPDTFGGSPLLGVRGACVVGHGSSSAEAVKNGVLVCARAVRGDVAQVIERTIIPVGDSEEGTQA